MYSCMEWTHFSLPNGNPLNEFFFIVKVQTVKIRMGLWSGYSEMLNSAGDAARKVHLNFGVAKAEENEE